MCTVWNFIAVPIDYALQIGMSKPLVRSLQWDNMGKWYIIRNSNNVQTVYYFDSENPVPGRWFLCHNCGKPITNTWNRRFVHWHQNIFKLEKLKRYTLFTKMNPLFYIPVDVHITMSYWSSIHFIFVSTEAEYDELWVKNTARLEVLCGVLPVSIIQVIEPDRCAAWLTLKAAVMKTTRNCTSFHQWMLYQILHDTGAQLVYRRLILPWKCCRA